MVLGYIGDNKLLSNSKDMLVILLSNGDMHAQARMRVSTRAFPYTRPQCVCLPVALHNL
jgi:hypothetical protein